MGQVVYSYEAFTTSPDNYKAETSHVLCAYMGNNDMKYKGNYLGDYGLAVRQVTGRYVIEVLGNKTLYAVGSSGPQRGGTQHDRCFGELRGNSSLLSYWGEGRSVCGRPFQTPRSNGIAASRFKLPTGAPG